MNNLREKIEKNKQSILDKISDHKDHIQQSLNHSQQKLYEKLVKIQDKMDQTQKKLVQLHGKAQDKQLEKIEKLRKKQESLIFFKQEQDKFQMSLIDSSIQSDQKNQQIQQIGIDSYEERKSEISGFSRIESKQEKAQSKSSVQMKPNKIIQKCLKTQMKISQINLNSNPKTLQAKLNKLLVPDIKDDSVNQQVQKTISQINELFITKSNSNNGILQPDMEKQQQSDIQQDQFQQQQKIVQLSNDLQNQLKFQETPTLQSVEVPSKEKIQECMESITCQICFDRPRCYIAVPCGHFIYCDVCKDLVKTECLLCRKEVIQLMKVFI